MTRLKVRVLWIVWVIGIMGQAPSFAQEIQVHNIYAKPNEAGIGEVIGTLHLNDTPQGLKIHAHINHLPPGAHGFHIHQKGKCTALKVKGAYQAGLAAGGHFDPHQTHKHLGPSGNGHLGDLPVLWADPQGRADHCFVLKALTLAQIQGRSFIIHQFGDNYKDDPKPLGGGGPRIACARIE